jgi:hypothetical protein
MQPGALNRQKPDDPANETHNPSTERPRSVWEAFGVSLRLFLPIQVIIGSELVPSHKPIDVKVRLIKTLTFKIVLATFATFFLQIPGWIIVPLITLSMAGLLKPS